MAPQSRPQPMNASEYHSKVKVTLTLSDPIFVAGRYISGKMEVESRADLDSLLGIGAMTVELFAIEEIISPDHSATSTFIHSRRVFQGPGLPPSNAVHPDYVPADGEPLLPAHHHPARRGLTTFFFRFPLPLSSPASIRFGPASIRYEVRANVSVAWRGDRRLVTDTREVRVVESLDSTAQTEIPQAVSIAEGGKLWARASITNGAVIGGEAVCIDLQLKNYTSRWTCGVTVFLTRSLHLSKSLVGAEPPLHLADIITQVDFRGPEYSLPPGIEGLARLVIDVPRHFRGTMGSSRLDDNGRTTDWLFEVSCAFDIRVGMSFGSEDVSLILPVTVHNALALPVPPVSPPAIPSPPHSHVSLSSTGSPLLPLPHRSGNYDPAWSPRVTQPIHEIPTSEGSVVHPWQHSLYPYDTQLQRSTSTGPQVPAPPCDPPTNEFPSAELLYSPISIPHPSCPLPTPHDDASSVHCTGTIAKGPQAFRISHNLHQSVRHRSVSPYSRQCAQFEPSRMPRPLPSPHTQFHPQAITISPLPNSHGSRGGIYSPRPIPSPKHSLPASISKSENVWMLERMANKVGSQNEDLSTDLPRDVADVDVCAPDPVLAPSIRRSFPDAPALLDNGRNIGPQQVHVSESFAGESNHRTSQASEDILPCGPPIPPIAAITPIKFPRPPAEGGGLITNFGNVAEESGLDALERRLIAEVGTRRVDTEPRPDARSLVGPITIPTRDPHDGVNDSAISSLTLADRDAIVKGFSPDKEQDRDSDERTQHIQNGEIPSDDDGDARTQKGKSTRRALQNGCSNEGRERTGRRRERKKGRNDDSRKLRKEAQGRVAAWLGGIDTTVPPATDDSVSPTSPLEPLANKSLRTRAPQRETIDEGRSEAHFTSKDASSSPNPRSSGFATISSLDKGQGSENPTFRNSPRRSSVNNPPRLPSPLVDSSPAVPKPLIAEGETLPPSSSPRLPLRDTDIEKKYNVRSARGGRGGKVMRVASLWAAKAAEANINRAPPPPFRKAVPSIPKSSVAKASPFASPVAGSSDAEFRHNVDQQANPAKATTVPAVISSSHAIPILSSTASLAFPQAANKPRTTSLAPMISETVSDIKSTTKDVAPRTRGELAFGKARLKALIQKYQG